MRSEQPAYAVGDRVRVVDLAKRGHVRMPMYIRDKVGTVARYWGIFPNAEERAYGRPGEVPVYRVALRQRDLWEDYDGPDHDLLEIDVFDHWLRPVAERSGE